MKPIIRNCVLAASAAASAVSAQAMAQADEWSDIAYIEGQYSNIYFDYVVNGATGTFFCANDWMANQDDGGAEGGLLSNEYNRFNFGLAGSEYEIRIYPDGNHDLFKDGINDPNALDNFQSATSWTLSPLEPGIQHAVWEFSFDVEGTVLSKFIGCDPPGPTVVYTPPPVPDIVTTGPSAFRHFVDAEFRDVMTGSTLPPIPGRAYQDPVRDPWFAAHDNGWQITLLDGGGVIVVTPAPGVLALLGLGGLAALRRRR